MAVFLKHNTGKVLTVSGKVATSQKCCCDQSKLTVTCDHPAQLTDGTGVYEIFTATLAPLISGVTPTGTVLWKLDGSKLTGWTNPVNIHSDGTAKTPSAGIWSGNTGSHVWSAEYSGDQNYSAVNGSFTQTHGGSSDIPARIKVVAPHFVTVYGNPLQYFNYQVISTDPAKLNFSGEIKMQPSGGLVTEFYGATDFNGGCTNPRQVCQSAPGASFQSSLILNNGSGSVNALVVGCSYLNYYCGDQCSSDSYILFRFVNSSGTQQATVDNGGQFGQSSSTLYVQCT